MIKLKEAVKAEAVKMEASMAAKLAASAVMQAPMAKMVAAKAVTEAANVAAQASMTAVTVARAAILAAPGGSKKEKKKKAQLVANVKSAETAAIEAGVVLQAASAALEATAGDLRRLKAALEATAAARLPRSPAAASPT